MSELLSPEETGEIVASFADRAGFEHAVNALLGAGFEASDLSVLASHDSLEIVGDIAGYHHDPVASVGAGLGSQLTWLAPLGIAGALLAAAGPVGAIIAAAIGAGAGAVALRPLFAELTESDHAARFADAIDSGRILLWVRTADAAAVGRASTELTAAGGAALTRLPYPLSEDDSV